MFRSSFILILVIITLFLNLFTVASISVYLLLSVLLILRDRFKMIKKIRIALLIISIILIYLDHGTWKGLLPASSLLGALCLLKLFEYDELRDYFSFVFIFQLFTLSLAIQVEDFYYLPVFGAVIVYTFYLLYSVFDHDLGVRSVKYLSNMFLRSIPFMVVLLVFFPRFQFGGFFFSKNFAKTGFSDSLIPGEVSKLINDSTELFKSEIKFPIIRSNLYWRGAVLTKNNNFSWEKGAVPDSFSYNSSKLGNKYSVQYSDLWNGPLFTLENTSHILLTSKSILRKKRGGIFDTISLMDQNVKFVGTVNSKKSLKRFSNFNEIYLDTTITISNELQNLLDKHKKAQGRPLLVVEFLKELFFNDFVYSLSPGEYDLERGLDDFIFKRKIGFCGHFTTASAILFRLFKIPARVVIGYQGGEYNSIGDFYTVTKKQAHTWVEFLNSDNEWTRFDPVEFIAPNRIEYGADSYYSFLESSTKSIVEFNRGRNSIFRKWGQFIQNVYYQSGTKFFNYDLELQKDTFKEFKKLKLMKFVPYLFILLVSILFIYFRKISFINLVLYLVLRKKLVVNSWSGFRYHSLNEIKSGTQGINNSSLLGLVEKYELITYTNANGCLYKLSFIFDGFKILLYEKSN